MAFWANGDVIRYAIATLKPIPGNSAYMDCGRKSTRIKRAHNAT